MYKWVRNLSSRSIRDSAPEPDGILLNAVTWVPVNRAPTFPASTFPSSLYSRFLFSLYSRWLEKEWNPFFNTSVLKFSGIREEMKNIGQPRDYYTLGRKPVIPLNSARVVQPRQREKFQIVGASHCHFEKRRVGPFSRVESPASGLASAIVEACLNRNVLCFAPNK